MEELTPLKRISASLIGLLYGLLYFTVKHNFLGFSLAGWLKNLSLLIALLSFLFGWGLPAVVALLFVAILLRLLYWLAKRGGYIRFMVDGRVNGPGDGEVLHADEKARVRVTGKFSVTDQEAYVVRQPADYWRVPMGDHAIMIQKSRGQFMYQFIGADNLENVIAGTLCHGRHPDLALMATFQTTWGTGIEEVDFLFYAAKKEKNADKSRQTIYFSFADQRQMNEVWRSLLTNSHS